MRKPLLKGLGFGITSGVITALGLLIGLISGTHSKLAVIGGILALAVADSLSDAVGIHISEEAENEHGAKEIWEASTFTLLSKFGLTVSFIVPVLLFNLQEAIYWSIAWGLITLTAFSAHMAKSQGKSVLKVVGEHVMIAALVIVLAHVVGSAIYEALG
ncbi:MAG: hypothetical protein QXO01_01450 [Nitrososphaerota archaeon]